MSVASASDLTVDYDHHPAFVSPSTVGTLDAQELSALSGLYEAAIASGPDGVQTQHFVTAFREFWSRLVSQYHDELTLEFITYLGVRVETLLIHQIGFLRKERRSQLRDTQGFGDTRYVFGQLSTPTRVEAQRLVETEANRFRAVAAAGRLQREDLSTNGGPSVRRIVSLLNREFRRNGVFDLLKSYYGRRFCVLGLSLELSDSRSTWWRHTVYEIDAPRTLYAHLDESIEFPKAILYLSDVSMQSGPTSVYPRLWNQMGLNPVVDAVGRLLCTFWRGNDVLVTYLDDVPYHQTFGSPRFRDLFMALPTELRFNSHLGWDVLAGSLLEQDMVARESFLTGPPGTYVVFDGARLFHRGGLIESGDRVACQIIFGPHSERVFAKRVWNRCRRDARRLLKRS